MIRKIESSDYNKGYMNLINTFTKNPTNISYETFEQTLQNIQSQNGEIYGIEKDGKIVSSIHLFFEYKLHNNCKLVCHIEDLVTDPEYRNRGYASALLAYAKERSKEKNCYKIVLCSNKENSLFYKANGFQEKGLEMSKYLGSIE